MHKIHEVFFDLVDQYKEVVGVVDYQQWKRR